MKNYLILYLILFNLFAQGQNSSSFYPNNILINSLENNFYPEYLANGILTPFDSKSNPDTGNWLVEEPIDFQDHDSEYFSSLILIEQLRQLDKRTPFNVRHNATIERFIRVYLQKNRENLSQLIGKSNYYFPIFEQHLDQDELPLELKYLAVVESALNQVAISPSGAKGLWQFMYGTGKEYGLHIDSYVDERFDLLKSTRAACAYLNYLYDVFEDWDLALAAYNSGPGNVKKAIKRAGGQRNYWAIRKYLPRETSSYVPAFYATMYLFSYADYHRLKPKSDDISYQLTDTIQVKQQLSFEAISTITGMDQKSIRSYNPQYKKGLVPHIENKTFSISLPAEFIPTFLSHEGEVYKISSNVKDRKHVPGVIGITLNNSHLVKNGDNLSRIAKMHHISINQLKAWNGLDTNFLIAGQRLVVTDQGDVDRKNNSQTVSHTRTITEIKNGDDFVTYKVKYGDTLFKISRKFGNVPISELRRQNDLDNVNYIKPGSSLKIKLERTTPPDKT